MKKRRFQKNAVHHVYQKPIDGIVIFHTRRDFIVFLTIFFSVSRKYPVRILSVCPMIDHLHAVLVAETKETLSAFVQEYTSKFVKEYNRSLDRVSGRMFTRRFGCAPKWDEKKARSAINYAYNNAPERKLCSHAIEYQWNLLAYSSSEHPFSEPIDLRRRSTAMKKAMSTVRSVHQNGSPLGYTTLGRIFKDLTKKESLQLTDFILNTYCNVDFRGAIGFYGSLDKMILAIDSNTGNEHEIKEEWVGYTDTVYADMGRLLRQKTGLNDMKAILMLPEHERKALCNDLLGRSDFIQRQAEKYLQLPDSSCKKRK